MGRSKKKSSKFIFDKILILISIIVSIYFINKILLLGPIEAFLRYVVIGIVVLVDLLLFIKLFKRKRNKILISGIALLLSIIYIVAGFNIAKIYSMVDGMNKKYVTYSASLIMLKDSTYDINKLKDVKIGILDDEDSTDGNIIPNEIINEYGISKNNEIVKMESYTGLLNALYTKELDLIFLPANYVDMFDSTDEFAHIGEETKVLVSKNKDMVKEESNLLGSSKSIKEPFTLLIIGIDSTKDGLGNADSFNGDSLILITFNPNNLNATMLGIPRDSYVPISCFKNKIENKITHAAQMGSACITNTIQDYFDIDIDYYAKINFKGLVDLVDAVGGVEVNVPYNMCEQDSQRRFGSNMIYIEKGLQTLNGEQALALSRNRKQNYGLCDLKWTHGNRDDYIRSKNQQEVIKALASKVKEVNSIGTLYSILDTISNNMDTNMSTETILSFYNLAKDILSRSKDDTDIVTIEQLSLAGYGQTIFDERSGLNLWNHVPNKQSAIDITKEMKVNLGLEEHDMVKEFSFSIKDNYKSPIVGSGPYKVYTSYDLLPNLVGGSKDSATVWASKNNIKLVFKTVANSAYSNGKVIAQDYPERKRIDLIANRTVTLTVVENVTKTTPVPPVNTKPDCLLEANANNTKCIIPNFNGLPKNYVITWAGQFSNMIEVDFIEEVSEKEAGTIIDQSVSNGTHVEELLNNNEALTITIAKEE